MATGGGGAHRALTDLEHQIKVVVIGQLLIAKAWQSTAKLAITLCLSLLFPSAYLSSQINDFYCLLWITGMQAISAHSIFNDIPINPRNTFFLGQFLKFNATFLSPPGFILAVMQAIFDKSSPFICIGLSSWRLWHLAHAGASIGRIKLISDPDKEGDDLIKRGKNISREEWFKKFVEAYIKHIRERCAKDLTVAEQVSFLSFAVGLLESESPEEYLLAARMLDMLIKNGQDASTRILGSRKKVKRLLHTVGSTQESTELRLLAASIVVDLAGGVRLAHFPRSLICISSLLEDTGRPKLIVQGLTILQRLADDPHNCADICQGKELLKKIMAPIHSRTLIHDMAMNPPWAEITNCSLRVVHQLIHVATGKAGKRLRHQISSDKQAITNLEGILDGESHQLQMRATEILSELVLDSSLNISENTRENLVRKQLQIFLADEGEQEEEVSADSVLMQKTNKTPINKEKTTKATAGEILSTLSIKSRIVSRFIVKEQSDIVYCLTLMLDPKNNIRYRATSAQILKNLCIHCKEHVSKEREILLPRVRKVLAEILATKTKTKPEASGSIPQPDDNEGTHEFSSEGNDIEMQLPMHTSHKAQFHQENEDGMKELQEALLYLTSLLVRSITMP
ncbi:hypothetical protein GUJ93_ZPchr0011g26935 [Zizania palustris]|uniref:Uncharacterized protein n=1 Tax=Zizania palustris TaxID=103762 RepID=A0A8J5WHT6_ZIZPA|nr:hypothetical protein GUJ93_ZPchr0011g26935 [Zizania palustris]